MTRADLDPTWIFIDTDGEVLAALQAAFAGEPRLAVQRAFSIFEVDELSAVYLTPMAAERIGVRPDPYEAVVVPSGPLKTDSNNPQRFPDFIVVGGSIRATDDAFSPEMAKATFAAVIRAVYRFNTNPRHSPLRRVCLIAGWFAQIAGHRLESQCAALRGAFDARDRV